MTKEKTWRGYTLYWYGGSPYLLYTQMVDTLLSDGWDIDDAIRRVEYDLMEVREYGIIPLGVPKEFWRNAK